MCFFFFFLYSRGEGGVKLGGARLWLAQLPDRPLLPLSDSLLPSPQTPTSRIYINNTWPTRDSFQLNSSSSSDSVVVQAVRRLSRPPSSSSSSSSAPRRPSSLPPPLQPHARALAPTRPAARAWARTTTRTTRRTTTSPSPPRLAKRWRRPSPRAARPAAAYPPTAQRNPSTARARRASQRTRTATRQLASRTSCVSLSRISSSFSSSSCPRQSLWRRACLPLFEGSEPVGGTDAQKPTPRFPSLFSRSSTRNPAPLPLTTLPFRRSPGVRPLSVAQGQVLADKWLRQGALLLFSPVSFPPYPRVLGEFHAGETGFRRLGLSNLACNDH